MLARLRDWLHERRIRRLRQQLLMVEPPLRAAIWRVMRAEINRRSPQQVARMNRDKGLV